MPERDSVITSSRCRPITKRCFICCGPIQKLARSTQRMDRTLKADLHVDNLITFYVPFQPLPVRQWLQLSTLTVHSGSRLHVDHSTNSHHSQYRSADYRDCCFMTISLQRKLWSNTRERTQNGEKELGTTRISKVLKLCSKKNSSEELSRERWQSYSCTSRLWSSSVWTSLGASEQGSPDLTHTSILALSNFCGYSWVAFSKIILEGQLRIWKPRMKPRNKRLNKTTSQINHTGIRLDSHIFNGNDLYMYFLGKVIHGLRK